MAKIQGYPVVADINFNTEEKLIEIDECFKLILLAEKDCTVSLYDNTHYKKYLGGVGIPIELDSNNAEPITKIYVKGTVEGILGVWGFK